MATLADLFVRIIGDDSDFQNTRREVRRDAERLGAQKFSIKFGANKTEADAQIKALKSTLEELERKAVNVPIKISRNDADIKIMERKLDELRTQRVNVPVGTDTKQLDSEIKKTEAKLTRLENKRIQIPIELERIAGEIGSVEAQLAALERKQINIPLKLDTRGFASFAKLGGAVAAVQGLSGAAAVAVGTLASLTAGIFSMGAAAAPAFGTIAAGSTSLLALIQGAGVARTAFSGVGDALKAMSNVDKSATANAQANAAARVSAAESIRSANRGIADALRNQLRQEQDGQLAVRDAVRAVAEARQAAGQRIIGAERDLVDAQETAREAQRDLTAARKDAATELDDLKDKLKGLALSEESAQIGLLRAQERLTQARKTGSGADALDRREALLGVAEAKARLEEVKSGGRELRAEAAQAERAGVDGSDRVLKAKKKVNDAVARQADAEKNVADTRQESAQSIARAQENETRTRAQVARSSQDAARAVEDAEHQKSVAVEAAAAAMQKQSSQAAELADALSKLSPSARKFVDLLHDNILPDLRDLKFSAQESLFPALTRDLPRLTDSLLPVFRKGIQQTGKALSDLADDATDLLTSGPFRRDFASIMESNSKTLGTLGDGFLSLIDAFTSVTVAALPLTERFADFVKDAAEKVDAFVHKKRASGELEAFFKRAGDVAGQLGSIIGKISGVFFNLGKAGSEAGQGLLDSFEKATGHLRDITGSVSGQNKLKEYFGDAANNTRAFGKLAADIGLALLKLGGSKTLGPLLDKIRTELLPALGQIRDNLSGEFGDKVVDLLVRLADVADRITEDGGALKTFVDTLRKMVGYFQGVLNSDAGPLVKDLLKIAGAAAAIGLVLGPIKALFGPFSVLLPLVSSIGGALSGVIGSLFGVGGLSGALLALTSPIAVIAGAVAALVGVYAILYAKNEDVRKAFNRLGTLLKETFLVALNAVKDAFNKEIMPALERLKSKFDDNRPAIDKFIKVVSQLVVGFFSVEAVILKHLIPIVVTFYAKVLAKAIDVIALWVEGVIKGFQLVGFVLSKVYEDAIKPTFRFIADNLNTTKKIFGDIGGALGVIWSASWDSITTRVSSAMETIKKIIGAAKATVGLVWTGLTDAVKAPIGILFGYINDNLIGNINKVTGVFTDRLKIPTLSTFADGGWVRGAGGPRADKILARLSNREFVVNADAAAKHGPVLEAINRGEAFGGAGDRLRRLRDRLGDATDRITITPGELKQQVGESYSALSRRVLGPLVGAIRERVANEGVLPKFAAEGMVKVINTVTRQADGFADDGAVAGFVRGGVKFGFPLPRGSYSVGVPLNGYPGHTGQDFPTPIGTPVFAPFAGQLTSKNLGNRSYGLYERLTSGGTTFIAGHLSRIATGDKLVRKGQIIGYSGTSGNSTGPHLHAEFRNARNGRIINPRSVLSYDKGGMLAPGGFGGNFGRKPERVLTDRQTEAFERLVQVLDKQNGGGSGVTFVTNVDSIGSRRDAQHLADAQENMALRNGWA